MKPAEQAKALPSDGIRSRRCHGDRRQRARSPQPSSPLGAATHETAIQRSGHPAKRLPRPNRLLNEVALTRAAKIRCAPNPGYVKHRHWTRERTSGSQAAKNRGTDRS